MAAPPIRITVLGSGTSVGVPSIGCTCAVCASSDPRDNRLRPSVVVSFEARNVLIDVTPDFRTQALRAKLRRIDAVLVTHGHADHILGIDDLRPINFLQSGSIPIYASMDAMNRIERVFDYVFDGVKRESNIPRIERRLLDSAPINLFGVDFTPVPVLHGQQMIYGFRFGDAAYLTDHSEIPEASLELLRGLDVLFLDALRYKPHPTHSTVDRSVKSVETLRPRRAFLTHISHDLGHQRAESLLPPNIRLAYDGLEVDVEAIP